VKIDRWKAIISVPRFFCSQRFQWGKNLTPDKLNLTGFVVCPIYVRKLNNSTLRLIRHPLPLLHILRLPHFPLHPPPHHHLLLHLLHILFSEHRIRLFHRFIFRFQLCQFFLYQFEFFFLALAAFLVELGLDLGALFCIFGTSEVLLKLLLFLVNTNDIFLVFFDSLFRIKLCQLQGLQDLLILRFPVFYLILRFFQFTGRFVLIDLKQLIFSGDSLFHASLPAFC